MQSWLSIRHWGTARVLLPCFSPAFPSSTMRGVQSRSWGDGCLWRGVTSKSPHSTWPWLAFPKVEECAVTAPSGVWQSWWQAACHVIWRWEAEMSKGTLWTPTPQHKSSSSKSLNFPPRETVWLVMTLIYCQIYFSFFVITVKGVCVCMPLAGLISALHFTWEVMKDKKTQKTKKTTTTL